MAKNKITLEEAILPTEEIPYEVPANWHWTRLKYISSVISKGTTPKGGKSAYKESGVNFLRVENINNLGEINLENIKYVDEEVHLNFLKRSILCEGDVLISIAGTLGKTALVKEEHLPLNTNQAVAFIRLKNREKILPRYVQLFLSSPEVIGELLAQSKVTAIPNLTLEIIGNCKIAIPPLEEQQRIVDKIDSLFCKLNRAETLVKEAKLGFEDRRAAILEKAFNGELTKKWREARNIDFEWKDVVLDDVCKVIMGQSPKGDTYNDIGEGTPLINGPVEFGPSHFSKTIKSKWTTDPKKMCKELDLILCVRGSTLGRINIAGFDACIGRGVAAIRAEKDVEQAFINYKIHKIRDEIYNSGIGTTFPNISTQQIKNIKIALPSLEEQRKIVEKLDYLLDKEYKVENLSNIDEHIDTTKKAVLVKAFRGELNTNNSNEKISIEELI